MKNKILELIDFKKIDNLLDGFKKTTRLATAILNLEGNVLSHSEWRKLCTDFYQKNPETSNWCSEIKIELAEKLAEGENFYFYKCSNGLIEVAIPILIEGVHFANLFSGLFFFEEPDLTIFTKERQQYGFDEKTYNEALSLVPVIPLDKIKATMDFLLGTIQFIIELAFEKVKQIELNDSLSINKLLVESIIDNSPALIYVADTDGKIKLANKIFQKIFDLPKSEIVGKYRQEIMPAAIANQHRNNDIDVIQSKKSMVTEEENIEGDGKHFYISQKFPLFDLNGNINAVGGVSTDITENKRIKEALEKSKNKYKSLFENSADGIILFNEQSEIVELNNKICEILEYDHKELKLLKGYEFIHSEDLANKDHAGSLIQLQQGKTLLTQYRLRKKDGNYIPTELTTKMIGDGQFLNIIRDISERVLAEKSLQESETKYRLIADNSGDTIFVLDIDLNFTYISPAVKIMRGYEPEEAMKLKINEALTPVSYQKAVETISELLKDKSYLNKNEVFIKTIELEMFRIDKTTVWTEVKASLILDDNKNPIGFLGVTRDITEKKKIIDDLIIAKEKAEESDRLKSAFLANISHEIRTPMNGILGFAQLLKEPNLKGGEQKKYIKIIEKSGNRMLNIINDIVDISKIEAGLVEMRISETNINEQLDYAYTFFKPEANKKGIQLIQNITLSKQEATINTDREKLYAILLNLIKNAIKYTDTGTIEIGYKLIKSNNDSHIEFYISDTGIGISANVQEAIFERFIQADIVDRDARQGTGLGLSISKAFVKLMGGTIRVESTEGKGSVFYFTLPYSPISPIIEVESEYFISNDYGIPNNLKILIAEDDDISDKLLSLLIAPICGELLIARDGAQAVELCKNNPDIDIILMDIQMPIMNGYEATRQIRLFNKNVKIIAQTAFALSGDEEKIINAGCNSYIQKPISEENLFKSIKENLK